MGVVLSRFLRSTHRTHHPLLIMFHHHHSHPNRNNFHCPRRHNHCSYSLAYNYPNKSGHRYLLVRRRSHHRYLPSPIMIQVHQMLHLPLLHPWLHQYWHRLYTTVEFDGARRD